jgi:hypothetical protein
MFMFCICIITSLIACNFYMCSGEWHRWQSSGLFWRLLCQMRCMAPSSQRLFQYDQTWPHAMCVRSLLTKSILQILKTMVSSSLLMEKVGMNATNYSCLIISLEDWFIFQYSSVEYGFAMKSNHMLASIDQIPIIFYFTQK